MFGPSIVEEMEYLPKLEFVKLVLITVLKSTFSMNYYFIFRVM